jgi:hypothetical protein
MLNMIKDSGKSFPVSHVPYIKDYEEIIKRFTPQQFNELWDYVDSNLPDEGFSVGTTFPLGSPHWGDGPLHIIYINCGKDKVRAGYFLGQLVFDIILNRDEEWFCTKTNITHRDFSTLFYFKRGDGNG